MSSRLDRVMKSVGIDYDSLHKYIEKRHTFNLDDWHAANPAPHTPGQEAELAGHISKRVQLVDQYWNSLPADTTARLTAAIDADARRWYAEQQTAGVYDDFAPPGGNPVYVQKAVNAELTKLAAAQEGCRNDTLHKVACCIFEFAKGGHVDQAAAWAELRRLAATIGLQHNEIEATLRSAWNRVGPRKVPAATGSAAYRNTPKETHR